MRQLCEKLNFPEEAIQVMLSAKEKMPGDFAAQYNLFQKGEGEEALKQIREMGQKSGIPAETADMVFLLTCVPYVKEIYKEKNISDEIFYDTFSDLTYKLHECHNTNGVWGTFVTYWYARHFKAELFALGRLQFEKIEFDYEYKDILKKGDMVINCHIPSSGSLTPELVQASLKKAYEFYGVEDNMYVMCHSWLLYPPYYNMFGKNTKAFCDLFDIFESEDGDFELWRVFSKWNLEDIKAEDVKTSLQKSFYDYLKNGGKTGSGVGIITYKNN